MLRSCLCSFFFCQAEDGIRDLVRSRGLGDVYKRQEEVVSESTARAQASGGRLTLVNDPAQAAAGAQSAVSYTNLTLPTSDLV